MREFQIFDAKFLMFFAVVGVLRLGVSFPSFGAEVVPSSGYPVAIAMAAGALLTWALGHGITPDRDPVRADWDKPSPQLSPFWTPWLKAASAALGVGSVASFGWAAYHDSERMDYFVEAVGPVGVALAGGVVAVCAILWAGWDLLFPPADDEPRSPSDT